MAPSRPSHATVVASLALVLALGTFLLVVSGAVGASVANKDHFYNSGLVKLDNGEKKTVIKRGPLKFIADCADSGGGYSYAHLTIKNTGTRDALFQSDFAGFGPLLPGGYENAFTPTNMSTPNYYGDHRNMFAAVEGGTAVTGMGAIGGKKFGADCLFQLVLIG